MTRSTLRRLRSAATIALLLSGTAASSTSATPSRRIIVQGAVLGLTQNGIVLLPNVTVSASDGAGVTTMDGTFNFTATFSGFPFEVRALIDGVAVRVLAATFARDDVVSVIIDLSFEAGVQILESIGLDRFTLGGIEAVLSAVFSRNVNTDYGGLSLSQAIALARRTAENDPQVQRVIAESMIEPQDLCVGDCDGGRTVTVDEVVTIVNIALGRRSASDCTSGAAGSADVTVVVQAIRNALAGCPAA